MVIIPIVVLILPADFFDSGQDLCLSKLLAGMECYGCGMTRAMMHLTHFEFQEAWEFNKLIYIVSPIIGYLWIKEFIDEMNYWKRINKKKAEQ